MNSFKNTLIQFTNNGMGSGDEELGVLLAKNYLTILNDENKLPRYITFYNSGVKLICLGSPAVEVLKQLEEKGVKLIACKTCLNRFEILDKVEVGTPGTMIDIIELQGMSSKVVNL